MPLLDASAQRLREQGRLQLLAQVLSFRAWAALELGNFAIAIPAAEESSRLSTEGQQPLWQSGALLAQAHIAAMRGDRATVERIIDEIAPIALPIGAAPLLSLSQVASGALDLGEARHAEAYEHLRRLFQPGDPACHDLTACHSIGDMVEAAVHSGHRDEAVALMSATEQYAEELPSSWFHAQLLLGRVQLAAEGSSDVFEQALTADLSAYPIMRARIELLYGEWLRRHRRRRESRGPLRAARETFDALGLSPWAERARRELRASGETSRRRAPDTLDELTPQELQIVQMAARGLSNRDIAQQLYLSHRTVETHLYRVFPKLGVTSRVQLVAALGGRIGAPI
jgi:ATP/maltotriose-dependent transcriptional regulator MalT